MRAATQSYPQTECEHHVLGDEDDACGGRKGSQNLSMREAGLHNLIEEGGDAERGEGREGVGLVGEGREEVQHVEGVGDDLIGDGRLALADALLQRARHCVSCSCRKGKEERTNSSTASSSARNTAGDCCTTISRSEGDHEGWP